MPVGAAPVSAYVSVAVSPASASLAVTVPVTLASSATAFVAATATGTSFVPVIVITRLSAPLGAPFTSVAVNGTVSTTVWPTGRLS